MIAVMKEGTGDGVLFSEMKRGDIGVILRGCQDNLIGKLVLKAYDNEMIVMDGSDAWKTDHNADVRVKLLPVGTTLRIER